MDNAEMLYEAACASLVATAWVRYDLATTLHIMQNKRPPTLQEAQSFIRDSIFFVRKFIPTPNNPVHAMLERYLQEEGLDRVGKILAGKEQN